jgi:hypothetical protein
VPQGGVNDTPINLIDLFPTFMSIAGMAPSAELKLDGCNILPLMQGKEQHARFEDGSARDTIFFHYPSPLPSSSIIRKEGWKLLLYHGAGFDRNRPEVQLYQLYHDDGTPCDVSESQNLAASHPVKRDELLTDLRAWLNETAAPLPYRNAHTPGQGMPHNERVPKILSRSSEGERLEVRFETGADKAKVVEAKLVYTTNGSDFLRDAPHYEEWFEAPATLTDGLAVAVAPPGMTHGVFYLRDENNYQVNSEWVPPYDGPGGKPGNGVELIEDGYAWNPGLISLIATAVSAQTNASQSGQNTTALSSAIESANALANAAVDEQSYALAMRALRKEIKLLDVPEAKLPVMNQFNTPKW